VQTAKGIPREQAGPYQGPLHAAGEDVHDGGNISAAAVRVTGILAALAALVTLATGVVVLFGWLLDIPALKSVLPGFVSMKANAAVGFVLAGTSLALLGRAGRSVRNRRLSQACAGITALLGLFTFSQYLFCCWDLGIDQPLFRAPAGAVGTLFPGRMAPATAIDFLLLGGALFLAGFRRTILASQWLALLAGVIGWLSLLGYLYGAPNLYGIGQYTQMAVHTAAAFIILGQGVLLAHPADGLMRMVTSDTIGRWLLRRLAPLAVAVPLVLGWLRVQGEAHGYFEGTFGVALMMLVLMVILVTMIYWTSRALSRMDAVRRQAHGQLRESEEALRTKAALLEAQSETSIDGILAVDDQGKSILFNTRFGAMWNIPREVLDTRDDGRMLHRVLEQLSDPDEFLAKVRDLYARRDERSRDEVSLKDGRTLDRYSSPLVDIGGTYFGRIWFFRDITERKGMEHELRRLAVIAEQAAEGIAVADLDGNLQFVNDAWARMHGYESGAELVGMHLRVFHTDEQLKTEVVPFNATVKRQGHHAGEVGHVRRDGTTFPTQMSVVVLKDEQGEPYGMAAFAEDITRRKRAEQERRRLAAVLEATPDFVGFADAKDTHILYINKGGRLMTGLTPDEDVTRLKISDVHPEWANRILLETVLPTAGRDGLWTGECAFLHRDGHEIPIMMALLAHKTPSGEVEVFSTISRDITEQKQAEDAIRQAKDQAERANAAKSAFLANMSHEIRTPMTAIMGFTEMLINSIECCTVCPDHQACPTRAQIKENVQVIYRNGEHLLALINDVLDLSKVEAGKIEIERGPCSPVQIVEETVSLMRVRAIEKGLTLDARYEFPLPEAILSDPARVRQILINLVGNAVKFTSAGHVRIGVRCSRDAGGDAVMMAFEVVDTGIGMTPEQVGRLFQPFAQADSSTTRQYGGTGLGLAISKKLAKALGGDIQVVSRPGEGSTFTFTMEVEMALPVHMLNNISEVAEQVSHRPQSTSTAAVRLRGRVLLAEDGPDNRLLISTVIRRAGAEVDLAVNGLVAVEMALAARLAGVGYDVILMDMQMPEMDGYEATRKLRQAGYTGAIIALTAHAMAEDRAKCIDAGCDDYATKPIDRLGLLTTLARLMGSPARQGDAVASPELGPEESPAAATQPEPAATQPAQADGGPIKSQFADDPGMSELIEAFITRLPETADAMAQALANNCFDELRRLAHQLKGSGGGYGYPSLTEQARKLEDSAHAADGEAARLALNELKATVHAVVASRDAGAAMKEGSR